MSAIKKINIIVFGNLSTGRSSLTFRFVTDRFVENNDQTIEDYYYKEVTVNGETVSVRILDTVGDESWGSRYFYSSQVREAHGIIFVYDTTRLESLEGLDYFLELVGSSFAKGEKIQLRYVLCGNKCDLESERKVSTSEGESVAKSMGCPFFETSAKMSVNVEEAFMYLIKECLLSNDNLEPEREESRSKCIIC